jgi:putative transposase
LPVATLRRDRDTKFTKAIDETLRSKRVKVKMNQFRSPNTNAVVERFVQSIQQECLDRFVMFGETYMDHMCQEYLQHYQRQRPHQGEGIDNALLYRAKKRGRPKKKPSPAEVLHLNEVECSHRLGCPLKSYSRYAA